MAHLQAWWPTMFDESMVRFLSQTARDLKYLGLIVTAGLSIYSQTNETTLKAGEGSDRKKLTEAGKRYLAGFLVLTALTISSAIVGDWADRWLSKKASAEAQEDFEKKLAEKFKPVSESFGTLNDGLGEAQQLTKAIGEQSAAANRAAQTAESDIEAAQQRLIESTRKSYARVTQMQNDVASTSQRTMDRMQDVGRALEEAPWPVQKLQFEFLLPGVAPPPSSQCAASGARPDRETLAACMTPLYEHIFAETLARRSDRRVVLDLYMNKLVMNATAKNCPFGSLGGTFCLETSVHGDVGGGTYLMSLSASSAADSLGVNINYEKGGDQDSSSENMLAIDTEVRGLQVRVCSSAEAALRQASLDEGVTQLPKSIHLIQHALTGVISMPGASKRPPQRLSHDYVYFKGDDRQMVSGQGGGCMNVPYKLR